MDTFDVVIVGGRVAGAATALLLARAGHDVVVVERDRRGTDTLSTHALMRPAVVQLRRWGLLDEVVAAGTPPQHHVVFHYGDRRVDLDLSSPLYAPRRTVLDPILVAAAERAGARFEFGVDVVGLRQAGGRVVGVEVRDGQGGTRPIAARVTVGADGRRSRVARSVDAPVTHAGRVASGVMYGYWSGVEARGYEWAFAPGTMAGLIPTNDDLVCVYAGVPRDRFLTALRHDLDGAITRVVKETSPDLSDRIAAGQRRGHVRGFAGLAGWLRRPRGPGWALVGDAAYFKDPATAHGITDALRDADLLARDLHRQLRADTQADGHAQLPDNPDVAGADVAGGTYETVRDRLSLPMFAATNRIASFEHDLAAIQDAHLAMSDAMQAEAAWLYALPAWPPAAP